MEGSDQVARNEWMCIFHAKEGAQGQGFKAELTPRCGGIYGRNRWEVTFNLLGLFSQEGQESAKVVQMSFAYATENS